jgi:hypothetical protein
MTAWPSDFCTAGHGSPVTVHRSCGRRYTQINIFNLQKPKNWAEFSHQLASLRSITLMLGFMLGSSRFDKSYLRLAALICG